MVCEDPRQWDLKVVQEETATRTCDWEVRVGDTVVITGGGGSCLQQVLHCGVGKSKSGAISFGNRQKICKE